MSITDTAGAGAVRMTPGWRKLILPRRDGPAVPIAAPDASAVDTIRTAIFDTGRADIEAILGYRQMVAEAATAARQFLGSGAGGGQLSARGAGVVAYLNLASGATGADYVDFWIADYGLGFATQVAMQYPRLGLFGTYSADFPVRDWWPLAARFAVARRLRERLTLAGADEYDEAAGAIDGLRIAPWQRCAAAFMFPTNQQWVAEACRTPTGLVEDRSRLELLTSVDSVDAVRALLLGAGGDSQHQDYRQILPTLVDRFGDGLVPVLDGVLRGYLSKERAGVVADALACLPGDKALQVLMSHAARDGVRPGLLRAVTNFPERSRRILPALDTELARELMVAGAVGGAGAANPDAGRKLPALLANPPWTGKRQAVALPEPPHPLQPPEPEFAWAENEFAGSLTYRRPGHMPPVDWARAEAELAPEGRGYGIGDTLVDGPPALVEHTLQSGWTPRWVGWIWDWWPAAMQRIGPRIGALAVALAEKDDRGDAARIIGPIRSAEVAVAVAGWLAGTRRSLIAAARGYLHRHGAVLAPYLLPTAAEPPGRRRDAAHLALRYLAERESVAAVIAAVGAHDPDALGLASAILDVDPLLLLPKRIPQPPDWARPVLATPVRLTDGTVLPPEAVDAIVVMLMLSGPVAPYAGIDALREVCNVADCNALCWALLDAWWAFGAPAAHKWALDGLAWFADDESIDRIAKMIQSWPGLGKSGRVPHGLDVLSAIGTDHALLTLFRLSQKGRSKPLKEKAAERLSDIAAARGLSDEQMADRLIPDLGLDDSSATEFDYGTRRFSIFFDELLQLQVRDQEGALLRSFPKPGKRDDPELAEDAYRRFGRLKRAVRVVAKEQLPRLETAMIHERRWNADEFEMLFVRHPVMVQLARRLVWAQYEPSGALRCTFRIAEDCSYADADDDTAALDPVLAVGIAHPLQVTDGLAVWAPVFADYEILQPFEQIGREVTAVSAEDLAGSTLARFADATAPTFALMGLRSRGWMLGEPIDGPERRDITRSAPRNRFVEIDLDPGIPPDPREVEAQSISVRVSSGTFGEVGAIFTAEVVADIARAIGR